MGLVFTVLAIIALAASPVIGQGRGGQQAPQMPMGFFITSTPLNGANLGGLAGADAHCQQLASAVGAGNRTWRAYLSTQARPGQPAVNARDRIGSGPWYNARGSLIAANVADLHGDVQRDRNQINRDEALTEKGDRVNGRGDQPNQHDILTGSDSHGRAFTDTADHTCNNYTSNADGMGSVQLGHHDRSGGGSTSWNSAHASRGCSQANLISTGGNGYLYCFAAN